MNGYRAMMGKRYELTKLLDVMYMRSLNAHLRSPSLPVVVAAVDPGYCHSDILRHLPLWIKVICMLAKLLFARRTAEGAKPLVWTATAGQDNAAVRESLKGAYTSDCKIAEPGDYLFGSEGQECETRLWVSCLYALQSASED
jgi:retinol dehydrogenase-12